MADIVELARDHLTKTRISRKAWDAKSIKESIKDNGVLLRGLSKLVQSSLWPPPSMSEEHVKVISDITKQGNIVEHLTQKQADFMRRIVPPALFALTANRAAENQAGLVCALYGEKQDGKIAYITFELDLKDRTLPLGTVRLIRAMPTYFDIEGINPNGNERLFMNRQVVGSDAWVGQCIVESGLCINRLVPEKLGIDLSTFTK